MNIKNIFFGISLLILSGLIFFFGSSFPNYVVRGNKLPGPKFFPFTLAVIIIILGTYYIIKSLIMIRLKRIPKDATLAPSDKITLDGTKNVIAIIVGIIFFVPLINLLGFILGATIVSAALMIILNVKIWRSLVYSVILVVIIFLIFGMVFKVPLPEGIVMAMFQG